MSLFLNSQDSVLHHDTHREPSPEQFNFELKWLHLNLGLSEHLIFDPLRCLSAEGMQLGSVFKSMDSGPTCLGLTSGPAI